METGARLVHHLQNIVTWILTAIATAGMMHLVGVEVARDASSQGHEKATPAQLIFLQIAGIAHAVANPLWIRPGCSVTNMQSAAHLMQKAIASAHMAHIALPMVAI